MKALHMITFTLLVVGGLNWGIEGLWGTGIGAWVGGGTAAQAIYVLVGLSALYTVFTHKKDCKMCG
ncbi:MAG: DUF378 domain-containing protein [Patescibacteria group bacterium]